MKRFMMLGLLVLGVIGWCTVEGCTGKHDGGNAMDDEAGEVRMTLGDCPPAVRETIQKNVGDGKIEKVVKEMEGGKLIYSVDAEINGQDYEINVAEDGRLISKEIEADEAGEKGEHGSHK